MADSLIIFLALNSLLICFRDDPTLATPLTRINPQSTLNLFSPLERFSFQDGLRNCVGRDQTILIGLPGTVWLGNSLARLFFTLRAEGLTAGLTWQLSDTSLLRYLRLGLQMVGMKYFSMIKLTKLTIHSICVDAEV